MNRIYVYVYAYIYISINILPWTCALNRQMRGGSIRFVKIAGTANLKIGERYVLRTHYKVHYLRGVGEITGTVNLKICGRFVLQRH